MKQTLLSPFTKRESLYVNTSFLLGFFLFLAFIGLLDAGYIAYVHYAHIIPPCINTGCGIVLMSKYTELVGIPNAVIGIGYYGLVMALVWIYWKGRPLTNHSTVGSGNKSSFSRSQSHDLSEQSESKGFYQQIPFLLLILTLLGLIAGIYLLYLQAAVIHAYCQYCITSEVIDFLLFDCAWWLWRRSEKI